MEGAGADPERLAERIRRYLFAGDWIRFAKIVAAKIPVTVDKPMNGRLVVSHFGDWSNVCWILTRPNRLTNMR